MQPEIRVIPNMRIIYADGIGYDGSFGKAAGVAFQLTGDYITRYDLQGRTGMVLGFTPDDLRTTPLEEQRYRACFVITDNEPLPADDTVHEGSLDGGKMAVFPHRGPYDTLPNTWRLVMEEWMPASGLTMRWAMPFEVYVNMPGEVSDEELLTEIYMPVE
jgi:AraC family transcriptional regulator